MSDENAYRALTTGARRGAAKGEAARRLEERRQAMTFRPSLLYKRAKELPPAKRTQVLRDFQRVRRDVVTYSGFRNARSGMRSVVRQEKAKVRKEGVISPIEIGKRYAEIEKIARVGLAIAGIRLFNAV